MEGGACLKAGLICGAGHSGSTVLGMVLGSHSQTFYMGEGGKVRYLGDETKQPHKRLCKLCGEGCPIWGGFRWDPAQPLYHQVAARSDRRIIIDSTKDVAWIAERIAETRAAGIRPHLFLLLRDGRAVVNSRLRKYPDRDPERLVRDWVAQIEASQALYDGFDGPKMRIRYEAFATEPESVMREACAVMGLDFEPAMLRFHAAEHHPLGGNDGPQFIAAGAEHALERMNAHSRRYYQDHGKEIRLDLRWKHELSAEHLGLFNDIAGHLNNLKWGN